MDTSRTDGTNSNEKLFGKYDELIRLLLGFLLTGLIGSYLSQRYTTQQADLSAAGKIFSEHSKLIGDRYFTQNQLTLALQKVKAEAQSIKKTDIDTQLNAYKEVLQEWNSARGFNREMIKLYFGDRMWNKERNIHYDFRAWGQALEGKLNGSGTLDFKCLEEKTDALLVQVHSFQIEMAQAIQAGKVGGSRDQSSVEKRPIPDPFCP